MCKQRGSTGLLPIPLLLTPKQSVAIAATPPAAEASSSPVRITKIFTAIIQGDSALVARLVHGGRVRDLNELHKGYTAAHHAAYHGQIGVLRTLADHGASFTVPNKHGETAVDAARANNQHATVAFLQQCTAPTACAEEVRHASRWVATLLDKSGAISAPHAAAVGRCLGRLLRTRFEDHWHVGAPHIGSGYRALTTTAGQCDRLITRAIRTALPDTEAADAALDVLPRDFSVRCDPGHVAVRVGSAAAGAQRSVIYGTAPEPATPTPAASAAARTRTRARTSSPAPLSPKASSFEPALAAPSLPTSAWSSGASDAGDGDGWPPAVALGAATEHTHADGTWLLQQQQQQQQFAAFCIHQQHIMLVAQAQAQAQQQAAAFHQRRLHTQHAPAPRCHQQHLDVREPVDKPAPSSSRNLAAFVLDALEKGLRTSPAVC